MPTPTKGARFGGSPAHEKQILANLARALFTHGRITTTQAKAKRLRPYAEKLITKGRRGDLHARRQVLATLHDKTIAHVLFTEIGPRFATRPGGYTRITKIGPRHGDNAPMAVIELVEPLAEQVLSEAEGATRRSARDTAAGRGVTAGAGAVSVTPAPAEAADEVGTDPVQDEADDDDAALADAPDQGDTAPADETAGTQAAVTAGQAERAADGAEVAAAEADATAVPDAVTEVQPGAPVTGGPDRA